MQAGRLGEIGTNTMDVDAGEEGGDDGGLRVQEIDAYWLQRRVAAAFPQLDASAAQRMAADVFGALQVGARSAGGGPRPAADWHSPAGVEAPPALPSSLTTALSSKHLSDTRSSHTCKNTHLIKHPSSYPQEDASVVENKVVQLLGLDQFPLAKELLRNRAKIVWVTKLRQAQVRGALPFSSSCLEGCDRAARLLQPP